MSNAKTTETGGRSLKNSVLVGLALGGAFLASILIFPPVYMVLAGLAAGAGAWELSTALRTKGWRVPRIPAVLGSVLIMPVTYFGGATWQWLCALATVAALIIWRGAEIVFEGKADARGFKLAVQDFAASAFLVIYLPLMTSFSVLLLKWQENGQGWVVTYLSLIHI